MVESLLGCKSHAVVAQRKEVKMSENGISTSFFKKNYFGRILACFS